MPDMTPELCHCGGTFQPADHGLVPLAQCTSCGREVPAVAVMPTVGICLDCATELAATPAPPREQPACPSCGGTGQVTSGSDGTIAIGRCRCVGGPAWAVTRAGTSFRSAMNEKEQA